MPNSSPAILVNLVITEQALKIANRINMSPVQTQTLQSIRTQLGAKFMRLKHLSIEKDEEARGRTVLSLIPTSPS